MLNKQSCFNRYLLLNLNTAKYLKIHKNNFIKIYTETSLKIHK